MTLNDPRRSLHEQGLSWPWALLGMWHPQFLCARQINMAKNADTHYRTIKFNKQPLHSGMGMHRQAGVSHLSMIHKWDHCNEGGLLLNQMLLRAVT